MNKFFAKITSLVSLSVFVLTGFAGVASAQNQVVLPNAGLTPESPFYFFDRFGETLREFFTFNPEGKARLQITFAAERVAEIKVILDIKGVQAKGLEVAQSRLKAHLASAADIVTDQKAEGKDVSKLAKELNDKFESPKSALKQSFKEQEKALEAQEKKLKAKIREARLVGDTAQIEALVKQLGEVKAQKELLELKEEEQEEALEKEEERIKEEMEAKEEAEKAIREAEKEKLEVLDEAVEDGLTIPAEAFGTFDSLLTQAKSALAASNYLEAKRLAKQAEKSLDAIEDAIEDLEKAKDEEEKLKEEQEEKKREAKEKQDKRIRKDVKKDTERLENERERAKEDVRKAEERLREAGRVKEKNEDQD